MPGWKMPPNSSNRIQARVRVSHPRKVDEDRDPVSINEHVEWMKITVLALPDQSDVESFKFHPTAIAYRRDNLAEPVIVD